MSRLGSKTAASGANYATVTLRKPSRLPKLPMPIYEQPKEKKMNFIKQWIVDLGRKFEIENEGNNGACGKDIVESNDRELRGDPLRLNVFRANGGTIVETTKYDPVKDRHFHHLHIITHDVDMGEGLAKIITMESLRG